MNTFLDDSLVTVLLMASAAYAFSALGPRALRRRALAAFSAWLERAPAGLRLRGAARRLAQAAETKSPGACGGCETCGAEAKGAAAPGAASPGAVKETTVPMANIGRIRR